MAQTSPKCKLVMLVEDSSIDIYISSKILEQSELAEEIIVKETAQEALEYLKQYENIEEKIPDLIFLDLNMPGVDGFDFLSEFKNFSQLLRTKIKIVILTSSDKTEDIHIGINNPLVKRYFLKPLTEETMEEVKRMLK